MDLVEVNEAFATLPLLHVNDMGVDPEKLNVNGGAVCIGHPVGASGIRVLGTLAHEMNRRKASVVSRKLLYNELIY
jgi:acetyl-CoA C-acetyltransferase